MFQLFRSLRLINFESKQNSELIIEHFQNKTHLCTYFLGDEHKPRPPNGSRIQLYQMSTFVSIYFTIIPTIDIIIVSFVR